MGWTYFYNYDRASRLELCRREFGERTTANKILKDAMIDNVYYAAMKHISTGEIWGLIVLTDMSDGEFGYKDMSEDMMPYYFDCPADIIKLLSPTTNPFSNEWRERCLKKAGAL